MGVDGGTTNDPAHGSGLLNCAGIPPAYGFNCPCGGGASGRECERPHSFARARLAARPATRTPQSMAAALELPLPAREGSICVLTMCQTAVVALCLLDLRLVHLTCTIIRPQPASMNFSHNAASGLQQPWCDTYSTDHVRPIDLVTGPVGEFFACHLGTHLHTRALLMHVGLRHTQRAGSGMHASISTRAGSRAPSRLSAAWAYFLVGRCQAHATLCSFNKISPSINKPHNPAGSTETGQAGHLGLPPLQQAQEGQAEQEGQRSSRRRNPQLETSSASSISSSASTLSDL